MSKDERPRRRRRAVGPAGAKPAGDEPLAEQRPPQQDPERDREWYEAQRPPHHESR